MENKLEGGDLVRALIDVQGELGPIMVNAEGYNYMYLSLPEILRIAKPVLAKHGVLLQQFLDINGDEHKVTVNTLLMSAAGESMRCSGTLGPTTMKGSNETQELGASGTYLRRFQAMTILGLVGEDDDDEKKFEGDKDDGKKGSPSKSPNKVKWDGKPAAKKQKPTEEETQAKANMEERTNLIKAMTDIVGDPVFSEDDKVIIRSSIKAAKGDTAALKAILMDVQEAFDEKKGKFQDDPLEEPTAQNMGATEEDTF